MAALLISLVVIVATFGVIAATAYRRVKFERLAFQNEKEGEKAPSIIPAIVSGIVGFVLLILVSGITQIEPGHVGVVSTFGHVNEYTLPSGISYVIPIANNVTVLDTRVQVYEFADLEGATSDLQPAKLTGTVNYRIDAATAWRLYRDVGLDFAGKIFTNPATTDLKTVTPHYTATVIISKRDEIAKEAKDLLTPQVAPYGISVEAFYVSNIGLNQAFLDSVEQKQIAQQQVLTQQQITQQKEEQKKQQKIDAEGAADAARAKANGDADAILALANAQADANKALQNSLTPELIQYTMVNKLSPTISTILLPSDQSFILDPKALGQ